MADLADLLAAYPSLLPEERAAVDEQVAGRPDLRHAHDEARQFAALLDAGSAAPDPAQSAAARRLGSRRPERDRRAAPDAEAVDVRLDRLEAEAEHAGARFERLTGRPLPDPGDRPGPTVSDGPPDPPAGRRPPRRLLRWITAAALLALGYGALWAASAARATDRELTADLGAIDARLVPEGEPLADAFAAVGGARRSVLGLFPRYDPVALDSAARLLSQGAQTSEASSWPSQEARLALARVHLYRQRDVEAARVLGGLVREGGYRAPAARRMLDFVRAQDAAPADSV